MIIRHCACVSGGRVCESKGAKCPPIPHTSTSLSSLCASFRRGNIADGANPTPPESPCENVCVRELECVCKMTIFF